MRFETKTIDENNIVNLYTNSQKGTLDNYIIVNTDIPQKTLENHENLFGDKYLLISINSSDKKSAGYKESLKRVYSFYETLECKRIILIGFGDGTKKNVEYYDSFESFVEIKSGMDEEKSDIEIDLNKVHTYRIPDKYYSPNYRLVDIQAFYNQTKVIYIFRDRNNKKEIYEMPFTDKNFYWYESETKSNKIIESYDNLNLVVGDYLKRNRDKNGYGGDNKMSTLHAVDYYLKNQGEPDKLNLNIMYFDIEVYGYNSNIFPEPSAAEYPINAVSFCMERDKVYLYLCKIDNEIDPNLQKVLDEGDYKYVTIFNDERTMLKAFFSKLHKMCPDFLSGWNTLNFDFPYILNRMKILGLDEGEFSPFSNCYANGHQGTKARVEINGYIPIDQLVLYKNYTYSQLSSYSLDNVAEHELKENKVEYSGSLDQLYNNDIKRFIDYSIHDTRLLIMLEEKIKHIAMNEELRTITTTGYDGVATTLGQAEGLFLTSMKKKGLIARNRNNDTVKEKLPGAYVFEPRGGLFTGLLCDFDFTSLYPSIINSWNISPDTYIAKIDEIIAYRYIYDKDSLKGETFNIQMDPIHNNNTTKINLDTLEKIIDKYNANVNISGCLFIGHDKYKGIYYTVIDKLFNGRKVYKKLMLEAKEASDDDKVVEYNGKQMAYKILANSLYGALANEYFKFYNNSLAKSITLSGQELLKYCAVHADMFMSGTHSVPFKPRKDFSDRITKLKNIVYGDTDSIFIYLTEYLENKNIPVKDSKEVWDEIEKIQDYINDVCLSKFEEVHNLTKKYSIIYLKNEYLFSKYYSLNAKKKYASKVISQEGKDVKFLDIKGLEIKRSEIPKSSQDLLNELLDLIMGDKDFEVSEALDIVDKHKNKMLECIQNRDSSVVRVISFSKPRNQYKTITQHLKGMLIWNDLINEDFRPGNKGRLWNLKGIDLDKAPDYIKDNYHKNFMKNWKLSDLDVICVPEDKQLPECFILDTKKIIEYACDDRADNFLEPLMQKTDTDLLF